MLEKYRKCTVLVGARPAGLCIHRGVYTAGVPSGSVLGLAILPVRVRGWNSEHDALPRYCLTKLLAAWPQWEIQTNLPPCQWERWSEGILFRGRSEGLPVLGQTPPLLHQQRRDPREDARCHLGATLCSWYKFFCLLEIELMWRWWSEKCPSQLEVGYPEWEPCPQPYSWRTQYRLAQWQQDGIGGSPLLGDGGLVPHLPPKSKEFISSLWHAAWVLPARRRGAIWRRLVPESSS